MNRWLNVQLRGALPVFRSTALLGAAAMILMGCGFALDTTGTAPSDCGFGDAEVEWSGTGTLQQLGLHADSEFPHREVGDAFVVSQSNDSADKLFCFTLENGDEQGERWTVRAPVPEAWTPPRP